MRLLRTTVPLVLALGLCECGGGGGGTTAVALTGENGVPIAAQAYGASRLADGMFELVEGFAEILDGEPTPLCAAGSLDVTVNDAPPADVVSAGDSLVLMFDGCGVDLDGEFVTLDGALTVRITEVIAIPPGGRRVRFTVTYGNLALFYLADSVTLNGRMEADATTADGISHTTVVTGDLSLTAESGGETASVKLGGFRSEETYDEATGDYAWGFSGMVSSSAMGGAVDMESVAPFTGNGDAPPTAGESVLRGAGGSEVRIVAMGGLSVRIFIDADGDGTPENIVDTTWNDIG